jgi:hypothetical protein
MRWRTPDQISPAGGPPGIQTIPGVGPILGAVFVADIGGLAVAASQHQGPPRPSISGKDRPQRGTDLNPMRPRHRQPARFRDAVGTTPTTPSFAVGGHTSGWNLWSELR